MNTIKMKKKMIARNTGKDISIAIIKTKITE